MRHTRVRRHCSSACILAGLLAAAGLSAARAQPCEVTPSPFWKTEITVPDEPFAATAPSLGLPPWIKFTIMTCDPEHVYYQDCRQYTFHYDFVSAELDPYRGIAAAEFEQLALQAAGQELMLGTVLTPPWTGPGAPPTEYGIQFIRHDPYTPDEIIDLFHFVTTTVGAAPSTQAYYFPTYEQWTVAAQYEDYLAAHGVPVSSPDRWARDNTIYSAGWALGRLKHFPAPAITSAYLAGDLRPEDILLTDGVPAEIPYVAGILTLQAATPSSHAAILAQSYGVPFVHLARAKDAQRAAQLVGRRIALRAYQHTFGTDTQMIDVEDQLDDPTSAEILALKTPAPLDISPVTPYGAYSAPAAGLVPEDIRYFGGKAAHYGFLRRELPEVSPVACALSFDLWTEFMDQPLGGGQTLRAWIAAKLAPHTWPPDMAALAADLDDIRDLIKDKYYTAFSPAATLAILDTLQDPQYGFTPTAKIRFRSSANVEDAAQFTGAGLYDSYSGCLLDDLDGDESGPSHCDLSESGERGVFRAIRKVFASFYNDRAYLERLRHGVNPDEVGMALLVHHSFPDEFELANGVATIEHGDGRHLVTLVTQAGAVSVTNPEGGAIPEEVIVSLRATSSSVLIQRYSSLVVLGETVLAHPDDYLALAAMMRTIEVTYCAHAGVEHAVLDFEYKKVSPGGAALPGGGLVITQVRPLPQTDTTPRITPFLLNEPLDMEIYQGYGTTAFANHRLKSRWQVQTHNMWLTPENLAAGPIFANVRLEYTDGCSVRCQELPLADYPYAWHTFDPVELTTTDGWTFDFLPNPRHYRLSVTGIGALVSRAEPPLLTLRDFNLARLDLEAEYDQPEPFFGYEGPGTTLSDQAHLAPVVAPTSDDRLQVRDISSMYSDIHIQSTFYWPAETDGVGSWVETWPLGRWQETIITGLTTEPIVLHDWWAQSYAPSRHNFTELYAFEPRLDPDVPPDTLADLDALGVQIIWVRDALHMPDMTEIHLFDDHDCLAFSCGDGADCGHPDHPRYCAKPVGDCDGLGTCALHPVSCPPEWDPVCGCEGLTYPNTCHAARAGVNADFYGVCGDADLTDDGTVDEQDLAMLADCLAGPQVSAAPACLPADLDLDGDVDLADLYRYQWLFTQVR